MKKIVLFFSIMFLALASQGQSENEVTIIFSTTVDSMGRYHRELRTIDTTEVECKESNGLIYMNGSSFLIYDKSQPFGYKPFSPDGVKPLAPDSTQVR